jgi:hypothetical protein
VDYRKLNDVTKENCFPLPRIDDILDTLAGAKWFSILDLKSGYWQLDVHADDKENTAFSTGQGLWQYTVMFFVLCNAPATFERLMESVLRVLRIRNRNWPHIPRAPDKPAKSVSAVPRKPHKTQSGEMPTFQKEVRYRGHILSAEGIPTDPEKLKAVWEWPTPKNRQEVRSFLGLCTCYRRYISAEILGFRTLSIVQIFLK